MSGTRYKTNKVYALDVETFTGIINSACNITDALRKVGYTNPRSKRSRDTLLARISELGIDTSHFSQTNVSVEVKGRYTLEDILVENSTYVCTSSLKKRLIKEGVLPNTNCAICGISSEWNGKPLNFHLDHINGVNNDNRLDNLRLICPNCHSQTETYAGRNTNK